MLKIPVYMLGEKYCGCSCYCYYYWY